jgi:hypothetical protein
MLSGVTLKLTLPLLLVCVACSSSGSSDGSDPSDGGDSLGPTDVNDDLGGSSVVSGDNNDSSAEDETDDNGSGDDVVDDTIDENTDTGPANVTLSTIGGDGSADDDSGGNDTSSGDSGDDTTPGAEGDAGTSTDNAVSSSDSTLSSSDSTLTEGPTSPLDAGEVPTITDPPTELDAGDDAGAFAIPTCIIIAPLDGTAQPFSSTFIFVASASDPEDGPLSGANIQWTSDIIGPIGSGENLQVVLDPPYEHEITCTATDSDGLSGSDTISVDATSPAVEIFHPGDAEVRGACPEDIPFVGFAEDYEEGDISADIEWSSDLDGVFGAGTPLDACLSSGLQTVTATVADSDANMASAAITLTITAP